MCSKIFAGAASPLARLERRAARKQLELLLADEPPQVAGAILARLDPRAAAAILAEMPVERQRSAVMEHDISRMTELPAAGASKTWRQRLRERIAFVGCIDARECRRSVAKAAEILNAAGRDASTAVLNGIGMK